MKLNGTLIKSAIVAALGGLVFGFDTAVISGTTDTLTQLVRPFGFFEASPWRARC